MVNRYGRPIRRWNYAPEKKGAAEFQRYLESSGIVGTTGHTDAKYDHLKAVFDLGCKLITHLYSGTSTFRNRKIKTQYRSSS